VLVYIPGMSGLTRCDEQASAPVIRTSYPHPYHVFCQSYDT
jgi:hypothetical protein